MDKKTMLKAAAGVALPVYLAVLIKVILLKHIPFEVFLDETVHSPVWKLLPRPFEQVNYIPLKTIKLYINSYGLINDSIIIDNIAGNVLLFLPLGLLMRLYFSKKVRSWMLLGIGLWFSFTLEVLQYVSGIGIADVDDVLLNGAGMLVGVLIGMAMNRAMRHRTSDKEVLE